MKKSALQTTLLTGAEETASQYHLFLDEWYEQSDTLSQKTSGSTGIPKSIKISKNQMLHSAELTGSFFDLKNCKTSLLCISPNFIGGKMLIVRSLHYQLDVTLAPTNSNPIKHLNHPIDFAAMVPLQVATILKETPKKLDLIKYLIIGGAPVSVQLEKDLQISSCKAYSTYGMTETISHIALKRLDNANRHFEALGATWFETNAQNQLIIHAPNLGISNLKTNDIVKLENKHQFKWLGRADFVINSGGVKIHPELIEKAIEHYLPAGTFFITSLPDQKLGEKVVLVTSSKNLDFERLKTNLKATLHPYEIPKKCYFLEEFDYTLNGKLNRTRTVQKITPNHK